MTRCIVELALVGVLGAAFAAGAEDKACGLLTAAELESAVGGKVSGLSGSGLTGANAHICTGHTPTATVVLRMGTRSASDGKESGKASKGIEMVRKMGVQVDVKTFGPVTCSTMIPPKNLEQYGFNTTCSVVKGATVAAIEVGAKAQKDMVSIDKLRPLAEKMASRF